VLYLKKPLKNSSFKALVLMCSEHILVNIYAMVC